jgi:hypothetical protein
MRDDDHESDPPEAPFSGAFCRKAVPGAAIPACAERHAQRKFTKRKFNKIEAVLN